MNEIPNKLDVEMIPYGSANLRAWNVSETWLNEDIFNGVKDIITSLIDILSSKNLVAFIETLRLITITSNIAEASKYWDIQLGRSDAITQHEFGYVAGKTIIWGDGKPESTYAVILLNENEMMGLVSKEKEAQQMAMHLLLHELSHIDTEFILKNLFGKPLADKWLYTKISLAHNIWSEFNADAIATSIKGVSNLDNINEMFLKLLSQSRDLINAEILEYRSHVDMSKLWSFANDKINTLVEQIGRCLGSFYNLEDSDSQLELFLSQIHSISPKWADVTRRAYKILCRFMTERLNFETTYDNYYELGALAIEYFHAVGLIPKPSDNKENGLWVDIRFLP